MKKYATLFLFVSLSLFVSAQKTWNGGSGNWNDASKWTPQVVPVANDIVIFDAGGSSTISNVPSINLGRVVVTEGTNILLQSNLPHAIRINNTAGDDFVLQPGSSLTLGDNLEVSLTGGATAEIAGTFVIAQGNSFQTSGGLTNVGATGVIVNEGTVISGSTTVLKFEAGSTYIHARDGGSVPTAIWDAASNVRVTGISSIAPGGLIGQSFGNFEWSCIQLTDIDLDGGLDDVKGDLLITKTCKAFDSVLLHLSRFTDFNLNIGGDFIVDQQGTDSTRICFVNEGTGKAFINVEGNYEHRDGFVVFVNVNMDESDGTAIMTVQGNLTQFKGDINFTDGLSIGGPPGRKGSLNLKGNLLQLGGEIRTTTGNDLIPNGLITFNGTGIQTYRAAIPAHISYVNYIIGNGSTLKLESDLLIQRDDAEFYPNWMGKLNVEAGGVLNASTFRIGSQVLDDLEFPEFAYGEFNLLPDARLITASANGVEGTVPEENNLIVSLSSESEYEFQGASTGVFTTTPVANTISSFIVNRPGGEVMLDMPITLSAQLVLTAGTIGTTMQNLLTVGPLATASPATTTSFVNGPLAKRGTAPFVFPVGKEETGFRGVGITDLSGSATYVAEFFRGEPPTGTLPGTLVRVSVCEYWSVSKIGGDDVTARMILSWEANSGCGGTYVTDATTLRVAYLANDTWTDQGRLSTTGTNAAGTITASAVLSEVGVFALGSTSPANPLPVVFADVKATLAESRINVSWKNLTEQDVAWYYIERSADGVQFGSIGQEQTTRNDNTAAAYMFVDESPLEGANYYRIRAVESTGNTIYSQIVKIDRADLKKGLQVYPNPVVAGKLTLRMAELKKGRFNLQVTNSVGQNVKQEVINSQGGYLNHEIDLRNLQPGNYILLITGDSFRETYKFVVQ